MRCVSAFSVTCGRIPLLLFIRAFINIYIGVFAEIVYLWAKPRHHTVNLNSAAKFPILNVHAVRGMVWQRKE